MSSRYEGQMNNGSRHGQGIFYYLDGRVFKGSWVDDLITGQGVEEGNALYQGEWLKGKWHGKGKLTLKDSIYEGQFFNGKPHGTGVFSNVTLTFEGHFNSGVAEGEAIVTYKTG